MYNKILVTAFLFGINQFFICSESDNTLTDSDTTSEKKVYHFKCSSVQEDYSDKENYDYKFSDSQDPLTNYVYLRAWLINHKIVELCKNNKFEEVNNLITTVYELVKNCNFNKDDIWDCIDCICYDNGLQLSYQEQ